MTEVAPGDQVAIYYIDAPADSIYARRGRPNIGPGVVRMGVDVDGAFAEYVAAPGLDARPGARAGRPADARRAHRRRRHAVPRARQDRAAPAGRDARRASASAASGSNAVQLGKHLGARVVAISRSEEKLELARRLGADEIVQAGGDDTVARARAACGGDGPDVVIQCAGSAAVDEQAIALATFGGRVVFVGSSPEQFRARAVELCWKELTLLGSRGFTADDIAEVSTSIWRARSRPTT